MPIISSNPTMRILGLLAAAYIKLLDWVGSIGAKLTGVTDPDAGPLVWTDPVSARHAVRVVCDLAGMPLTPTFNVDGKLYLMKDVLCACVQVESEFKPSAVHQNKVWQDDKWVIASTDYGIAQINDFYNIGMGKPFPSAQYVLDNPQADIEWMAKQFLAGNAHLWCSFTSGEFKKYLPKI